MSRFKALLKGLFVHIVLLAIGGILGGLAGDVIAGTSGEEAGGRAFGIGFATGGLVGVLLARPLARTVRDAETRFAIGLIQLGLLPFLIGGAIGYLASGNDGRAIGGGVGVAVGVMLVSRRLVREDGLRDGGQRPDPGEARDAIES